MEYEDRVFGSWLGKSIGGTLGLPAEGRMDRQHFSFYDPVPVLAPPNDDLELQLVWLDLVERSGGKLTAADFADAWLRHIHYMWDEYGRCRWNLRRGVSAEAAGTFENDFADGMGSPIRSEIWACLFPGDPGSAAHYAALDASLDHGIEGIAGEVFFAVMQSQLITGRSLLDAISDAAAYLPGECRTARAISMAIERHGCGMEAWECREELVASFATENFTYAPLNVALTAWALAYGDGDFEKSLLLAVNAGYDTDCTAATVGASLGMALGREGIPARWSSPLGDKIYVGPGIKGIRAPGTLAELTSRTIALRGKLAPKGWSDAWWTRHQAAVSLSSLPGTIWIQPSCGGPAVAWANGELPPEVKRAGGASWNWEVMTEEPREIVCLAREGARLLIDDNLIINCEAGGPYVPAPHRCLKGARSAIVLGAGVHRVRLELAVSKPVQDASVILTYPNLHFCPWSKDELPHFPELPPPGGSRGN